MGHLRYELSFFTDPTGAAILSTVLAILAVLTSVARGRPGTGGHCSLRHDDGKYRPDERHLPEPSLGKHLKPPRVSDYRKTRVGSGGRRFCAGHVRHSAFVRKTKHEICEEEQVSG